MIILLISKKATNHWIDGDAHATDYDDNLGLHLQESNILLHFHGDGDGDSDGDAHAHATDYDDNLGLHL